ncbi:hypothetical protein DL765_008415 [Monosporascus sp. GIB2]|nr:hypothetical protein DL765_008415 [Monosporascus sp. GIB2]
MESLEERLCLVRERIAHMEASYDMIRKIYKKMKPEGYQRVRDIEEQNGRFPPLPPRLPWPEYALRADPVDQDEDSLKFYLACERGIMSDVVSFIGKDGHSPKQAVRQYGLEQASFGYKSEVARYLLENGTLLHNNCFIRSVNIKKTPSGETDKYAFIDVGSWHPNQPWETYWKSPRVAICTPRAITDITLLKFLLAHSADPNVSSFSKTSTQQENRDNFVKLRRPLAQFLLDQGLADVNEAKKML